MKVAITGSTGFIGKNLINSFSEKKWDIVSIKRDDFNKKDEDFINLIDGADVVVNLAGAPIIKRWTKKHKVLIYSSRINTTKKLVKAVINSNKKPSLFISSSAIGIYPDYDSHTENSNERADDFIGSLCIDWEKEVYNLSSYSRVVIFRTGLVLGKSGGALNKMIPFFKLGFGGRIGNGNQAFSWIHIEDLINAFHFIIKNAEFQGVFNLTAPGIVSNKEFTKSLGQVLNRPAIFYIPPLVLKILYGEGASALVKGQEAVPEKLLSFGFRFKYPSIKDALKDIINFRNPT